jgi:hypothetical protein
MSLRDGKLTAFVRKEGGKKPKKVITFTGIPISGRMCKALEENGWDKTIVPASLVTRMLRMLKSTQE